jgi:hypothetical protein
MRKAILRTGAAMLIGAAIAPAAPAVAQDGAAATQNPVGSEASAADRDQVVLRRDGDRAVRFDPVIRAGDQLVLRRDGSSAVPFEVGAPAVPVDESFHWGDALIGAASASALILLGSAALALIRRRRPTRRLAQRPA